MNSLVRIFVWMIMASVLLGMGTASAADRSGKKNPAQANRTSDAASQKPTPRPTSVPMNLKGVVAAVNPWQNEIVVQDAQGMNTLKCHAQTWILNETSSTLANIPSNVEVSVLGKWQGDEFRFKRIRSFAVPALPPYLLTEGDANGFLVGNVDNLALRTPERIIPLQIPNDRVVVVHPGTLSQIKPGEQVELWGRRIGQDAVCDGLFVFNLTKSTLQPVRKTTR